MDVAFAADGRRVAELCRDLFDGGAKIALGLSGAVEALKFIESHRRENRPGPSTEIFRGDVLARKLLARLDDFCDAPVAHAQRPLLAAFAGEAEPNLVSADGDMPVLEG